MAQKNYLTDADFDDAGPLKPVKTSAIERVGDLGLSALKGAVAIPEAVVGLADLATGGRAGKAAEGLGLRFKDAKQALDEKKSVAAQLADRRFNEAEGFGGKLGAAIENPSLIANAIAESVPLMGGGAVVGRGIAGLAPKLGSAGAAAAGEGIVGAGSAAEAIRQETTNGELTGKQALLAGGTGLATGLIGAGGARAAKALGVGDIDTALVKGTTDIAGEAGKKAPGMLSSVGRGALAEGVLEELPQSMAEQSLQNVALDRPWEQDLDAAAAMGLVTGGAMGGGMGLMGRQTTPPAPQPQPAPAQPPVTPAGPTQALGLPAPVVTVDSAGRAMTADDRNARQQKWANGDVTDVTPIRETPAAEKLQFPGGAAPAPVLEPVAKPSEQMGLNPSAGPLSAAAVTAVDGDATPSMQAAAQATAQQEQATQSQQQADNKVKSSGWSMNEFPVGDYPMVATFDDKEQPLFMFQSGNEFDVLDANEKVVARGNSFEEAAGKAKLYKTGLTKATAPALEQVAASNQPATPPAAPITTQGATNGTQADQAQQAETQRQEAPAATGLKPGFGLPTNEQRRQKLATLKGRVSPAQPKDAPLTNEVATPDVALTNDGKTDATAARPQPTVEQRKKNLATLKGRMLAGRTGAATTANDGALTNEGTTQAEPSLDDMLKSVNDELANQGRVKNARTSEHRDQLRKAIAERDFPDVLKAVDGDVGSAEAINQALQFAGDEPQAKVVERVLKNRGITDEYRKRWGERLSGASDAKDVADNSTSDSAAGGGEIAAEASKPAAEKLPPTDIRMGDKVMVDGKTFTVTQGVDGGVSAESDAADLGNGVTGGTTRILKGDDAIRAKIEADKAGLNQSSDAKAPDSEVGQQWTRSTTVDREGMAVRAGLSAKAAKNLASRGWDNLAPEARDNIERGLKKQASKASAEKPAPQTTTDVADKPDAVSPTAADTKPGVVAIPKPVEDLLANGMEAQKGRITRLRNQAKADGMTLEEKKAANLKVLAAEATLRKMRTGRFDAEDAIAAAVKSGNADDARSIEELYPKAFDALVGALDATQLNSKPIRQRAGTSAPTAQGSSLLPRDQSGPTSLPTTGQPEQVEAAAMPSYGATNKLVTADRAAELRERLKKKLSPGRLNSGIDPEILAIGAELAVFHIEAGVRKFSAFAKAIAADLDVPVSTIRPYVRSWYNGARDLMEDANVSIDGMDGPDAVRDALAEMDKRGLDGDTGNTQGVGDERNEVRGDGAQALGGVAAQENPGAEGRGALAERNGRSGEADGVPRPGVDGAGVPEARSGRGGAEAADSADTGATGRGRRGGEGAGGDGAGVPGPGPKGKSDGRKVGNRGPAGGRGRSQAKDAGRGEQPGISESVPASIPATNFKITPDLQLGRGGEVQKFNDNMAAIGVLKRIEAENRRATPEEQSVLARYVGWGGLANAFPDPISGDFKDKWQERGPALRELLSKEEYAAARRSTRNAHYTSETVVSSMWGMAARLGFKGGLVLENSMGSGNFLGLAPEGLGAKFIGVEYDSLTSRIAQALYPQATVLHSGLQKVPLPENAFALNIGNPPFGSESLRFQFKPELAGKSIHNQFFLAGLDALRPGGLQIKVVSRYLMDAQDKSSRLAMAKKAKLVGLFRLPDNAFRENARTDVVTDIVVFQKLTEAEQLEMDAAVSAYTQPKAKGADAEATRRELAAKVPYWVETTQVADPLGGEPMVVNEHFKRNPGDVLGVLERSGSMQHGADITVRLDDAAKLTGLLESAAARLPANIHSLSDEVMATTKDRFKSMGDALRIALAKEEEGHLKFDADGKIQRVIERETPEGGFELARQEINANSPWSDQLRQDSSGRWYRLEVATGEDGKPVKEVAAGGKVTKRNVYRREVFASEADVPASLRLGEVGFERLGGMVKLRDLLKRQLELETQDAPKLAMEGNRKKLADAYQEFVAKHGPVNRPTNARLSNTMPDGGLVQALEVSYQPERSKEQAKKSGLEAQPEMAKPAPILKSRVVPKYEPATKAGTPADALAITLAETGRVDIDRIAQLLGVDANKGADMLQAGEAPLAFKDPEADTWETANNYLSGMVKRKLYAAKQAGLEKNVAALEKVQPEPWTAENVTVQMGSTWVPPEIYGDFVKHLTGGQAAVRFSSLTNSFSLSANGGAKAKDWGTGRVSVAEIVSKMLNSQAVVVRDTLSDGTSKINQEETSLAGLKAREINSEFLDWVFQDGDRRGRLVEIFNDKFNTRVNRQYDGSHLMLPGKVPDTIIAMRRHQLNAIWRGIYERFMLVDHAVGAGKTFTAIARAMERRRMGLSRKPMIVVPNHLVEQWAADVYRLYPAAKVLAAGKKDFEAKRRRRLFGKVATGDWDIVIVPHSSFGQIGIAPETEARYLEQEMALAKQAVADAWEQAKEDGTDSGYRKPFGVKEAEKLEQAIQDRMEKLNSGAKDRLLTFEQLGVDDLTVDEAHEFKNLYYSSRLTGVRGMGNKTGSKKANDLYNKVRVLRDSPTGSVSFLTGTPISNSAVEMFTVMRYLAADSLRESGLEHFDAWRSQYVEATPAFEPTESGRLKEVTRLGRTWSNMRSLMDLYYQFTDAVSLDDIKKWFAEDNKGKAFPVPKVKGGGDRRLVTVPPTPAQDAELKAVMDGFDGLDGISDPMERNSERLRLMDRARKLSLDIRAVNPRADSKEAGGKLEVVSKEVKRIYDQWSDDRGTQLIFLDRSVPKSKGDDAVLKEYDALIAKRDGALRANDEDGVQNALDSLEKFDANEMTELRAAQAGGWNAYQQIKDNLVAMGIPANEIRFIQEATNDDQKLAMFDAVNGGKVRVLIGSTPRMGAGTNVQQRAVALHHVDVTWKPSDIEQREGRVIRQGNGLLEKYGQGFEVEIMAYATERTVDAKMWDLNATKLRTINGIRNYDGAFSMEFEDEEAVGMAEMAALASGNPMLLERVKLESELNNLELLQKAHSRKMFGIRDARDAARRAIERNPELITQARDTEKFISTRLAAVESRAQARAVTIEGRSFDNQVAAMVAVAAEVTRQQGGNENARYAVNVNGQRMTAKAAIEDAVGAVFGDGEAFESTVGGKTFTQRTATAREIAAMVNPELVALPSNGAKNLEVGEMLGHKLFAELTRFVERGNGMAEVSLTLFDADGRTVASETANRQPAMAAFTTSMLRPGVEKLWNALKRKASPANADYLEKQLARAKEELPALEQRANEGFPKAQEMAEKRARLAGVVSALSGKGQASDGDAPAFSRNRPVFSRAAQGQASGVVQGIVDSITARWDNAPKVVVAFDMNDPAIPERVRAEDQKQRSGGATGTPEGFYYKGTVYLMSSKLADPRDVVRVLFHEALGHYGLRGVFGKELKPLLQQVATMRKAQVEAKMKEYGLRGVSSVDRLTAAEEVLAEMAQTAPNIGFVRRAVATIKAWLRKHIPGFMGMKMTDDEIIATFILPARNYVLNGGPNGGPGGGVRFQRGESPKDQTQTPEFKRWFGDWEAVRDGRQFYNTVTLEGAKEKTPVASPRDTPIAGERATSANTGVSSFVRQTLKRVNPESVSKVVDADGKPLVVYHGTGAEISEFRPTGGGSLGSGIYFTDSPSAASMFAERKQLDGKNGNVMPVYLSAKRILDMDTASETEIGAFVASLPKTTDDLLAMGYPSKLANESGEFIDRDLARLQRNFSPRALDMALGDMATLKAVYDRAGYDAVARTSTGLIGEPAFKEWAVFSPTQVKSATGNNGDFDGDNPDIRFSRSIGDALADGVNNVKAMQLPAGYVVDDFMKSSGKLGWWHKTVGTQYDLAQRNPLFKRVFDSAQGFLNDVSLYATEAANEAPRMLPKLESLKDLAKSSISAADSKAIAAPIFEGTLMWARRDDGSLVRVDMDDEDTSPGVVFTPAELREQFDLSDDQIALYNEFRNATDKSLFQMGLADMLRFGGKDVDAVREQVLGAGNFGEALDVLGKELRDHAGKEPKRAAVLLDTMGKMVAKANKYQGLMDKGYAPLSRFGRHTLDVLDEDGKRVYFGLFETEREANKMARRMQANYPGARVSQGTVSEEEHKMFAGVSPETVELFGQMLGLEANGDEASDIAFQQYLKMAKASRSAMKRLIHRKGIAGFSEDPGRVLAGFVYSNARQTSAALNMGELAQAVADIPKGQGELKDHAVRLHEYVKNPQEEAQAFRGLLFAQYIGGSVASAIINTTQPFAVTMPWLSQFGGAASAAKQMGRAAKDAIKKDTGDKALDAALKRAEEEGIVSPQEVFQLQAQAAGRATLRSGDGTKSGDAMAAASNTLSKLGLAWGRLFGVAEQFNRRTTFIAAYRTAVEQGMGNPAAFAERAISETQFVYSKANKPRWARGAVGATLFTFKQYSVSYVELMHRMATQGGPEGKKAALLGLAILFMLGGAGGLPFAEDVDDLIDGIMQRMGYNFSSKQAKHDFFAGVLGEEMADFMVRGVSGVAGMPVDVSGRFGMGNLIPGTGLFVKKADSKQDFMELAGPAGDLVRRGIDSAEKLAMGDVFGARGALATAAPLAGQNVAKALEMANTGMYLDKKGRKVLDVDGYDAMAKAIGLQPNDIAKVQDAAFEQQRMVAVNRLREAEIADKWARGVFMSEPDVVAEARADVAQWNEDNPDSPIRVTMPQIARRVREMRLSKAERVAKAAPSEIRARVREELGVR